MFENYEFFQIKYWGFDFRLLLYKFWFIYEFWKIFNIWTIQVKEIEELCRKHESSGKDLIDIVIINLNDERESNVDEIRFPIFKNGKNFNLHWKYYKINILFIYIVHWNIFTFQDEKKSY